MSDEITSECPAFKKGWSPDIEECIGCKDKFYDEYTACKKACFKEEAPESTPPAPKPVTSEVEKKPEIPKSAPEKSLFKGFREGTRADVLSKFLLKTGICSLDEAAEHLIKVFDIDKIKAMGNVKDYSREWSREKWNGKDTDLPFVVVIEADAVACEAKE